MSDRVSVVGLGKLGAPLAACFAARGFAVIGVDRDDQKVAAVNAGRAPVSEPGLQAMMDRCGAQLTATDDVAAAVEDTSATFVLVQTEGPGEHSMTVEHVRTACTELGAALSTKRGYHLVVIASTVPLGSTEAELLPALEAASGKRCGPDFGLCYAPEFVALGTVVHGFVRPHMALIGEHDRRAGAELEAHFRALFEAPAPIVRTTIISAELAKLAHNNFVAAKISFANLLARLCERTPGADVDAVTTVLECDPRIGAGFLRGGLSFGGPCLPRDVPELCRLARAAGIDAGLPLAVAQINADRLEDVARMARDAAGSVGRRLGRPARIGVLGLAFKPGTDVFDHSPGLALARRLADEGMAVRAHDPAAPASRWPGITPAETATACIAAADVIVLATPWPEYADIPASAWSGRVLIDCWRHIEASAAAHADRYIALGIGPPAAARR